MMWEEHPEYQKRQARLVGWLLLLLFIVYVASSIMARDWDLLEQILLFTGTFLGALGLLVGCVWMLVKFFTRKQTEAKVEKIVTPDQP